MLSGPVLFSRAIERSMLKMKFVKQLSIILSISFVAELMEYLIPIPVAASIYGLVLMLAGLVTKVIPLDKVEGAADFLVEAMPVMFIPPTVGIMTSVEALKQMLVPLTVISVVSTLLIMAVTGCVAQSIIRRDDSRAQRGGNVAGEKRGRTSARTKAGGWTE